MKTLNAKVTATFYKQAEGYGQLKAHWSRLMQDKEARKSLTAAHHILYAILMGRNWQKGLTPVTNLKKLENGGYMNWGARRAVRALHSNHQRAALLAPFEEFLAEDAICRIRELVPACGWMDNPLEQEPYRDQ